MTIHEIRQRYLDFFAARGHAILSSSSLLPENDPTTLFTGSGMQPMIPFLLGETHPQGRRLVDSQKCFRAVDIDEVGDNRHTTFFEMLGNWSLGGYFKVEQIKWMFEFLTREVGLDPKRLYVTVFQGNDELGIARDDEAIRQWQEQFASVGVDAKVGERILLYPEKKNWWSRSGAPDKMPIGEPGGPDSEMFWDFGAQRKLHENSQYKNEPCHVNCDCGRYVEIGNNVFMEYKKVVDGFELLPQKNVDFGGGLERIAVAKLDDPDIFMTDAFSLARVALEGVSGKVYSSDSDEVYAMRVILDHLRAAVFLIGDGVSPSNKDQGYFTRRLIRRAVRFGNELGVKDDFCSKIADAYIETYKSAYPDLVSSRDKILSELVAEEGKFRHSLDKGLREFEKLFATKGTVEGVDAFNLYQSYGFPWELTQELVGEKGQSVDKKIFEEEFKKHQDLSRAGSQKKFAGGLADTSEQSTKYHTATHLLHKALRMVIGDCVEQRGSNITPERLRFDFSFQRKMTGDEIANVESIVNEQIKNDLPVQFEMLSVEGAKKRGAIGLFEVKYEKLGNQIKVYTIGDDKRGVFSMEICGGPHVEQTGELGHFRILKEEAVASGIRRIKAVLE
jgi:alanyl-tRNA synthetase